MIGAKMNKVVSPGLVTSPKVTGQTSKQFNGYRLAQRVPAQNDPSLAYQIYYYEALSWNVMPVPNRRELLTRYGTLDKVVKAPYLFREFRNGRMHRCATPDCKCSAPSFEALFHDANVAVWLGRTSGNLTDIDCESEDRFRAIRQWFDHRNLAYLAYTSGRGGHLLFKIAEGEVKNVPAAAGLYPDMEIRGNGCYSYIAPSVHPSGKMYAWVDGHDPMYRLDGCPVLNVADLSELGIVLNYSKRQRVDDNLPAGMPEWVRSLSRANRAIIVNPPLDGSGTQNSILRNLVYDMVANIKEGTIPEGEGLDMLYDVFDRSGYAAKAPNSPREMINSAYHKHGLTTAKSFFGSNPIQRDSQEPSELDVIEMRLQSMQWTGWKTARTDLRVALALVQRARMAHSTIFRASRREIAELANISDKSAHSALHRLSGLAVQNYSPVIIQFVQSDSNTGANIYKFILSGSQSKEFNQLTPLTPLVVKQWCKLIKFDGDADADLQASLGDAAYLIYKYLLENGQQASATIVCNALEINPALSTRYIKRLVELGLVVKDGRKLRAIARNSGEIESIAANTTRYGKCQSGQASLRRHRHQTERETNINRRLAQARIYWANHYNNDPAGILWQDGLCRRDRLAIYSPKTLLRKAHKPHEITTRVEDIRYTKDRIICVQFDNGRKSWIDFTPILDTDDYAGIRQRKNFLRVDIAEDGGLRWQSGEYMSADMLVSLPNRPQSG